MYRVLIVDDEPIFRLGIRSCVDWEQIGYHVAGEAENGQKAVQMMEQLHPDLVFLDIRMPVMDGIEVLEWASTHQPDTEIVVLSCMNEYEYVRKAMRLGALDYLFKPLMESADIERVAREALQVLEGRGSHSEQPVCDGSRLRSQLSTGPLRLSDGEIRSELQALGLNLSADRLAVGALYLFLPQSEGAARREQVAVTARTLLQQELTGRCACLGERRGVSLLALAPECAPELPGLCRRLRAYTGVPASIGLSAAVEQLSALPDGIRQAVDALERRFVYAYGSVIPYAADGQTGDYQQYLDRAQPQIEHSIGVCDAEQAVQQLEEALHRAAELGCHDRETMCRFAEGCILGGIRAWRGRVVVESLLAKSFDAINALADADTMETLTERFRTLLQNLLTDTGLDPRGTVAPAVQQVQNYVQEHYDQNITQEQAAELVHMNKNYFCKLFKKETGDSFIAYLTKVRIERAIPLLMDGRWPAYQVAEMVGYNNYRYFCKLYKKHTGVTPGEVRRSPACAEEPAKPDARS